jgi:hypothetical protein
MPGRRGDTGSRSVAFIGCVMQITFQIRPLRVETGQYRAAAKPTIPLKPPINPPPHLPQGKVKLMDGERIVFTEESNPQNYLKLVASGDVDETMLEALEDYVKRQKKRLTAAYQAGVAQMAARAKSLPNPFWEASGKMMNERGRQLRRPPLCQHHCIGVTRSPKIPQDIRLMLFATWVAAEING